MSGTRPPAHPGWAVLVHQQREAALRCAFQLTHDVASAEDLVPEVMVGLLERGQVLAIEGSAKEVNNLNAYVRRAILNRFLNSTRNPTSSIHSPAQPDEPQDRRHDIESQVVESLYIWQLLGKLPARRRAVLVLRYYIGISDREIAADLDCSTSTVRTIRARAIKEIRLRLAAARSGELP